jgi:PadR family transcriptional regulator PadR
MKELTKIEEILLLAIWQLKNQAYGLKIRRHVSVLTGKDFTYGNLYSALNQLTQKKYVNKHVGEDAPNRGGKRRMYYDLSPSGFDALKSAYAMNKKLWSDFTLHALETDGK